MIAKITVPEVMPLVMAYDEANPGGGALHIVLHDGNLKQGHVEWCFNEAIKAKDDAGIELAATMLCLSLTQRKKIYQTLWHGGLKK